MSESSKLLEEPLFSKYLVNKLPDAVFCLSSDARFLYLNDAACRQLEYSREELLSMRLSDIDLDFSQKTWLEQWQSIKQQNFLVVKSRYQTRSCKIFPVELTFTYIKDQNKDFSCVFVRTTENTLPNQNANLFNSNGSNINNLTREISQLKKTKSQLVKTLSLVRGTLDSTAYGIVAVNYEGEVFSYNQKFLEMWKIPESLVLSKDSEECQNFFASQLENPEIFRDSVWEVSRESEVETYDILELKDGRFFAQYSKPQRLDGKIIGRVWSIWNITELKQQTEEKLEKNRSKIETLKAIEEAKQLSELRSRFLSMICHQFRSSLNIISFANSLLKRYANKRNDGKKLPYFDNIQTAVEQISLLLDELLFFGKSEVGQVGFEPKSIDLASFCSTLIAQMQPLSEGKQQTIEFLSRNNCKTLCIDQNILHHILNNLLSNAIKYSPNGSKIEFEVLWEKEQALFKIKDRGIGIPEVDRQRLFEPFFRGSNVDSIPGNGLGLSIVKNLVEIHGGNIEVESKVGTGTTFSIALAAKNLKD